MVRHHTPIRTFVWRNGRGLLMRYRERGILTERVPKRKPKNEWIAFTPVEQDLYDRIEEYISRFYRLYEERRRGLGFVMTVYRRRLTSSFHAARASLGRRREFLMDLDAKVSGALTDEDLEQDDLGLDAAEDMAAPDADARQTELEYLDDFIGELEALTVDSKLEFLEDQLRRIFQARDSAILFTQYTDTMDYLRDSLRTVYGSGVACYSGRGGESWDGERWILRSKESIKEEFRQGEDHQAAAVHRVRKRGPQPPDLRRPHQLRHAVEPHEGRAADRAHRPDRPAPRRGLRPQLLLQGHRRSASLREAQRPDRLV